MKTLSSFDFREKIVLLRADLNVPLENGQIQDDSRLQASLPTILKILSQKPKRLHLITHLGRPKGEKDPAFSTKPLQNWLEKALKKNISFREDFSFDEKDENVVQLHENVRFWPEEKKNPEKMAEILLQIKPDVFVMDAFGAVHRADGSIIGLSGKIPCVAGLLLEKEVKSMQKYAKKDEKKVPGLTILLGGAKMETKIGILKHFAITAEHILVGGALANTFLAAEGFPVGESLYEKAELSTAREVLGLAEKHGTGFHLPIDVLCAEDPTNDANKVVDVPIEDVFGNMKIFDLGSHTINSYLEILAHSKTIIWNGPVGLIEFDPFLTGTERIIHALEDSSAETILGGGDTLAALAKCHADSTKFTHISTGGGAMLTFLEGGDMPGLKILE